MLHRGQHDRDSLVMSTYPQRIPELSHGRAQTAPWLYVVVLCGIVSIICSIDRTAMSVAIIPMTQRYGWNSEAKGAIARYVRLSDPELF